MRERKGRNKPDELRLSKRGQKRRGKTGESKREGERDRGKTVVQIKMMDT